MWISGVGAAAANVYFKGIDGGQKYATGIRMLIALTLAYLGDYAIGRNFNASSPVARNLPLTLPPLRRL